MMQIVYIAGYGRSGSTLLDTLLGNCPGCFGAGELTWLFRFAASGGDCTCGERIVECPIWRSLLEAIGAISADRLQTLADLSARFEASRVATGNGAADYHKIWQQCFTTLSAETNATVIIDSSKTTRLTHQRLQGLSDVFPGHVRAIHLIRDPRAVMYAVSKGSNRKMEAGENPSLLGGAYRGLFSWIRYNLLAEQVIRRSGCEHIRVLYSDLASDPAQTIKRIAGWLSFDPAPLLAKIDHAIPLDPGHGISGNRMRRSPITSIKPDNAWQTNLSVRHRAIACLAWPLMHKYKTSIDQQRGQR